MRDPDRIEKHALYVAGLLPLDDAQEILELAVKLLPVLKRERRRRKPTDEADQE